MKLKVERNMMDEKLLAAKCRDCKKSPRNCLCVEYRLTGVDGNVVVYADNLATEPTRKEQVGTWQPRRNARVWRRPVYVDGFGPILYIKTEEGVAEVDEAITNGTFDLSNYFDREGFRVPQLHKDSIRRFKFLRRAFDGRLRTTLSA